MKRRNKSTTLRDFFCGLWIAFGISLVGFSIAYVSLLGF